jgi:site-specific DNA-methyltransferase (adenine-specific)
LNGTENSLYLADCIDLLREWYSKGQTNFIDLIYIDPPFNSNRNYNVLFNSKLTEEAFQDTWSSVSYLDELEGIATMSPNLYNFLKMLETTGLPKSYISYLTKMSIRCWYMKEMLKDTGSFYYHCDPTAGHYIKIILDYIFGMNNFKNEIIWCYKTGGLSTEYFPKKHDTIFFYTKTNSYTFNPQKETKLSNEMQRALKIHPEEFFDDNDGKGIYTWYYRPGHKKYPNGLKQYLEAYVRDYWDIPALTNTSKERLGYPTQKPENLLERIILASSNEDDLVADFFMGGGTTITVSEKLNRKWLGVDINNRSIQITHDRITSLKKILKKDYFIYGIPRSSEELRKLVDENVLGKEKNSRFAFEDVIVKYYLNDVIGNEKKVGDHSIDGRFMFKYNGKMRNGLVQVTTGAGIGHFKSFCSEIGKGTGNLGVYITFKDKVSSGMIREAKSYGKLGHVDKIQILTVEELVDERKMFEVPKDVMTI